MLKKALNAITFLAVLLFFLTGCPYSSSIPLSNPSFVLYDYLYGKWILDTGDEYATYYIINRADGKKFNLDEYYYDSEQYEYYLSKSYEAWLTDIGGSLFMNVEDIDFPGTYYLYKIDILDNDTIVLFEVTDNIDESFTDSGKMSDFFKEHMDLSFFYNSGESTYLRGE
jgi:hypothetical protein